MLGDLAVGAAIDPDRRERHSSVSGRQVHERRLVGHARQQLRENVVALGDLLLDGDFNIGEAREERPEALMIAPERRKPGLVRRGVGVIDAVCVQYSKR